MFHLLEMPNNFSGVDQVCCSPEEGIDSGCYHNCFYLPLLAGGARENLVASPLRDRKRLPGQGRLQHFGEEQTMNSDLEFPQISLLTTYLWLDI